MNLSDLTCEQLIALWNRETMFLSSVTAILEHPAYAELVRRGDASIPALIEGLRTEPHVGYYQALTAITGEDVAYGETTVQGAADRWLEWAGKRGL